MAQNGSSSSTLPPAKRQRQFSPDGTSPHDGTTKTGSPKAGLGVGASSAKAGQSSNFRNVSACNRCRLRKNRCDQKLPSCASCAKAGVSCVGYDPITKKEIPRSYVFYLETRVDKLEQLLAANNIAFPAASNLEICSRAGPEGAPGTASTAGSVDGQDDPRSGKPANQAVESLRAENGVRDARDPAMLNIVSPSKPKSLASASGVSFARVVFAAVQHSVSDHQPPPGATAERPGAGQAGSSSSGTSMRDSFFGLHTKPSIKPAPWPDRETATRFVTLYFEHANPQIPILHRVEFMKMFEQAYASPQPPTGARELYMLNMVFAIGCGVIVGESVKGESTAIASGQGRRYYQPEELHASAVVHLEGCLSSSGGGLEVLQAVLLLANFALLRPVPPGLWYIIGVAMRLAIDLGLHHEEGNNIDWGLPDEGDETDTHMRRDSAQERGRRLWIRDKRRRLWWCTYSLDRLVSTCVGRPFGISDQVITTELPSLLDDAFITPGGFMDTAGEEAQPSYKHVAYHYFRLRLLQSEILQVLQYNQAKACRASGPGKVNVYPEMHDNLPCPFLVGFDSYRSWRQSIDRRLAEWKDSAPDRRTTGVAFSVEFLELNYWQAIIMLYRQSLSVPEAFEGEYNTSDEVNSPSAFTAEASVEDEEAIYVKVAEAGQRILRIYRSLHLSSLVSYTYLSTHHLFMAGISYLYAIWHSPTVRSRLTMDDVDFTVLAAKSVFSDMIDKCPPAETCRDAFDRTAKATIKMAGTSGGFGNAQHRQRPHADRTSWSHARAPGRPQHRSSLSEQQLQPQSQPQSQQPFPFDMALSDTMSSPAVSAATTGASPSLLRPGAADQDYISASAAQANRAGRNPVMGGGMPDGAQHGKPEPATPLEPMGPSPTMLPRPASAQPPTPGAVGSAGYTALGGVMDTTPSSYDLLGSLGGPVGSGGGGGDFAGGGPMDQVPLDLGFGMNWEGMAKDYSEGQQMNPFDAFFFGGGGQQGGGGMNGGGMGL